MVKSVALIGMAGSAYSAMAVCGVYRYARHHRGEWTLGDFGVSARSVIELARAAPAGVIAIRRNLDPEVSSLLDSLDCPVVDIGGVTGGNGRASVATDASSLATLACEHFHELRLPQLAHFAASGVDEPLRHALSRNSACNVPSYESQLSVGDLIVAKPAPSAELRQWIDELPKPIGVLCDGDLAAAWLLRVCGGLGYSVPQDIAILGCGDEPLCRITRPELSSLQLPAENIGYEAARMLAAMMGSLRNDPQRSLIAATGVSVRASTKVEMMDPSIVAALDLISERGHRGITVGKVMKTQNVSRVTFERRFKAIVGRSPGAEIRRVRLEFIKKLLLEGDLTAAEIAMEAGFDNGANMTLFFKRALGTTPIAYRREASQG